MKTHGLGNSVVSTCLFCLFGGTPSLLEADGLISAQTRWGVDGGAAGQWSRRFPNTRRATSELRTPLPLFQDT